MEIITVHSAAYICRRNMSPAQNNRKLLKEWQTHEMNCAQENLKGNIIWTLGMVVGSVCNR